MSLFNPQSEIAPRVLASDLDGTLIPHHENAQNKDALALIQQHHRASRFKLIFATGRHFESVMEAVEAFDLPVPDWIVCDVGSAIYKRSKGEFLHYTPYEKHLTQRTAGVERTAVEVLLDGIDGLELQAPDHQQRFKISYQSSGETVDELVETISAKLKETRLPYECMGSLDPIQHCGLIDVLPKDVSKAYALIWLATHAEEFRSDEVIYAGDSGNDFAALICGFRAIIVANASKGLADRVERILAGREQTDRLYLAEGEATSGVLEGCRHFGLLGN